MWIIGTIGAILLSFAGLWLFSLMGASEGMLVFYNNVVTIICAAVILRKLSKKDDK